MAAAITTNCGYWSYWNDQLRQSDIQLKPLYFYFIVVKKIGQMVDQIIGQMVGQIVKAIGQSGQSNS